MANLGTLITEIHLLSGSHSQVKYENILTHDKNIRVYFIRGRTEVTNIKSVPFKVHPYIFLDKTAYIVYFAIQFCILSSFIFPQIVAKLYQNRATNKNVYFFKLTWV